MIIYFFCSFSPYPSPKVYHRRTTMGGMKGRNTVNYLLSEDLDLNAKQAVICQQLKPQLKNLQVPLKNPPVNDGNSKKIDSFQQAQLDQDLLKKTFEILPSSQGVCPAPNKKLKNKFQKKILCKI